MAQQRLECVESLGPETLVEIEPFARASERARIEPTVVRAPLHRPANQPGPLERANVLGGGCERHLERRGKFADGMFARSEAAQHAAAGRVRERVKYRIQVT